MPWPLRSIGTGKDAKMNRPLQTCSAGSNRLTPREREVMSFVTAGLMNKQVAAELGVSEITVKIHRGQAMRKMEARSLADLGAKSGIARRAPHKIIAAPKRMYDSPHVFRRCTLPFVWLPLLPLIPIPRAVKDRYLQKVPVIAIVDDDESVRIATRSLVRSLGFTAHTYASAEDF